MSRIVEEQIITRVLEAVAPITTIHWDPMTNEGIIRFGIQDMVFENGEYKGMQPHTRLREAAGVNGGMIVSIADLINREINVTLPDSSVASVSGLLLMASVKKVFEEILNERLSAQEEGGQQ